MNQTSLQNSVSGMLIRGGTSKGFLVREADFQVPDARRDDILLEMFGSPDSLQIDGIGGGRSHNSKFMAVTASDMDEYDVEYTYASVHPTGGRVSRNSISANLTSAVGMFAMMAGLVPVQDNPTTLSIYNRNTGMSLEQTIPVRDGEPDIYGNYSISGIPRSGALIETKFRDLVGAVTGDVLPTGEEINELDLGSRKLDVSVVDAARVVVFIRASDLDMNGAELPEDIGKRADIMDTVAAVRDRVSRSIGIDDDHTIAIVSEPQSYTGSNGERVDAGDIDVTARVISHQPHHAIGVSPSMCLAAASRIPGTIPAESVRAIASDSMTVGHPKGTMSIGVEATETNGSVVIESVSSRRTARPLMAGRAFYRKQL